MKEMINLNKNDIYKQFIIINIRNKQNIISEYVGIGGYGENSHLTHKFRLSYLENLHIYGVYYMIELQKYHLIHEIKLPFDIICIINQYCSREL